jgi:hypothetical protein
MSRAIKPSEWIIILGMAAWLSACAGPEHLTPTHGRAYRASMRMQVANPDAGKDSEPQTGLDSQEAAIVAEAYRLGLVPAGSGAKADKAPILMVAPED